MHALLVPASLVLATLAAPADAAEVQFEGFYRARFRAFDTLSLDRTNQSENLAAYAQHRLWLKPRFLLSEDVALMVELRALDGVSWGSQPALSEAYGPVIPNQIEYDLTAPTSLTDETAPLLDITLWRAYGQVHTPIGLLTFGRVPLHWGLGLWLNDGISVNPMFSDYGDTTDRLMWERLIEDEFYLRASIDVPTENLLGENDDTTAFGLAAAYRSEDLTAGILLQLDHTGRRGDIGSLNVFTADASAEADLGKLSAAAEVIGQFGGGDLDASYNDVNITAVGAALEASLDLAPWKIALQGGVATGDGREDLNLRQFAFDRDYSVGMFMFEQPMPILATTPGARDLSEARSGNALSNAIYLKPSISRSIIEGLGADLSLLTARTARGAQINGINQSRGYGYEIQLGATYTGVPHFEIDARGGLFLPGTVYSIGVDPTAPNAQTGFDQPAFGFQLGGRIAF